MRRRRAPRRSATTRSRRSQRQMPTSRTLAASTLNQARTPAISATSATTHAVTGPHVDRHGLADVEERRVSGRSLTEIHRVEPLDRLDDVLAGGLQRARRQPVHRVACRVIRVAVADGREVQPGDVVALEDREVGVVRQAVGRSQSRTMRLEDAAPRGPTAGRSSRCPARSRTASRAARSRWLRRSRTPAADP